MLFILYVITLPCYNDDLDMEVILTRIG